jgi:thymidylate synthase
MEGFYRLFAERTPDTQYVSRLKQILENGNFIAETPQDIGALTCFGTLAPMVFDLSNGVPLITERKIGFWKKPIAEIIAFINGARTISEIESYGCDFWKDYRGKGTKIGLAPDDMGPGSYGAVFHDYERADGSRLNQFEQLLEQIRSYPALRTHKITNWRADYTAKGSHRKVIVAPCHGDLHFRVIGGKLHMQMHQRSADFPIGVPSNMIQYAALLLMVCQVTGYPPGNYVHSFSDAHIYADQVEKMRYLVTLHPRPFPTLEIDPTIKNPFDFRIEHFAIKDYDPHPALNVPFRP